MDAIEKMCAQIEDEEKVARETVNNSTLSTFETILKNASRKERDKMLAKLTGQDDTEEPEETEESEELEELDKTE